MNNPLLTIQIEHGKSIQIELFADRVPSAVEYFLSYVNIGYYDGLLLHTCVRDQYIQCGYHGQSGYGAAAFTFEDKDAPVDQKDERLPCTAGTFASIEAKYPYLAKLQFALLFTDEPIFSQGHEILFKPLGRVVSGYEYAKELSHADVDDEDAPLRPVVVESVHVEMK